jgi:hypothetical protein
MFIRPAVTALLLAAATTTVSGQEITPTTGAWELRLASGALVATGSQRDHVKDAQLSAIQLARKVGRGVSVTGTFGWARSRDLATIDSPKLDVFTSDIGLEACGHDWFNTSKASFSTFAGIGGGARSYNYRKLDVDATNNLAGYVAAGGEIGMGRVRVRLEARDYATGFKPLVGAGKSEARNDVVILGTLRFNRRAGE